MVRIAGAGVAVGRGAGRASGPGERAAGAVVPLALAVRVRWFIRLGLMGYAATTIVGWAIQGPSFQTAYIAKAIEIALIALLAIDFARLDGNPVAVVKRELAALDALVSSRGRSAGAEA